MPNRVGKDAIVLTSSKIITTLITLVSAMLLARFRTLEEYGTYSQILLVTNLATALFTLGLPNSTNYFLALSETHEERHTFLSVYYTISTVLCLAMGIILAFSVPLVAAYFGNSLIQSFSYMLVLLPWTLVIIGSISNTLVVYGKTKKLMVFNVVNTLTSLLAILLTQFMKWSFKEYMLLYLIGQACMMFWVYAMVWKLEKPLQISFDKQLVIKILKYSVPIGLAGLVGTVSIEIDKLMIGRFLDTEQLAIYTNAAKELPLTIVAASLTAVLLPQMARMLKNKEVKGAIILWGCSIRLSYIIICFCSMALVVFAPQVMTILYSAKYLPGVPVFRVYSIVLLLRCTYWGLILNSIGKTKMILYSSIASLVLNVVLNYVLYLAFGTVGPAIATFCSILAISVFQLIYSSKELSVSFKEIFPWKELGKISVVNIAIGLIGFTAIKLLSLGTTAKDIIIAIVIGVFLLGLYALIMYKPAKNLWRRLNGTE